MVKKAFVGISFKVLLVDGKIYEAKKVCGNDKQALIAYIKDYWGIKIK